MNILNLPLVIVAVLLFATAVWWARRRSHLLGDRVSTARSAVQACNTLLALVAHIQQHRGMSTAWLAGDRSFERRLMAKRGEIEPLLAKLQQVAAEENAHSYPSFTPNDVSLWRHRWGTLLGELAGSSVEKSIGAHSNLIATLLNWLNVVGEARIDLPLGAVLPAGAVRNFSHRLPQLSETLGQARATGSGVAALGACPAVARVRLMFLVSRAESLIDQACAVDRRGQAAERLVKGLALTTRTHMLAKSQIGISAEAYFAEATRAIDAVFGWINDCGQVLQAEIDRAADSQASRQQLRLQGGK